MIQNKIQRKLNEYQHRLDNWAMDQALLPTHSNYQKFVIICNIRTGSTMLCSLLSSHSQVKCFFELFHRHTDSIPFSLPGYQAKSNNSTIVSLRNADPAAFLRQEIYKPQKIQVKAVGFKLLYPQGRTGTPWWNGPEFARWWEKVGPEPVWDGKKSDLWSYLEENTDIAVIHLKRKNLLRSKVSAGIAQRSGNWGVGATGGLGSRSNVQFALDFDECLQDFEAHRRMEDEADLVFENHRKLNLTYEELTQETAIAVASVQEFLGLERQALVTQTKKQANQPLSEVISNYSQLKSQFSHTRWKECFEE